MKTDYESAAFDHSAIHAYLKSQIEILNIYKIKSSFQIIELFQIVFSSILGKFELTKR